MEISNLVFATHNPHKLAEIQLMMPTGLNLMGLNEIGCSTAIPETSDTLAGNAQGKALHVFEKFGLNCFADDTGLEVEALGGKPGVYSARYAGPACNSEANIEKLLQELAFCANRSAQFKTVIALCMNGEILFFEGHIRGEILSRPSGSGGFGYDPIFKPEGWNCSFAECTPEEKNRISHRGIAFRKLSAYLRHLP